MSKKKWTVMALVDASYVIGTYEAETGEEAAEQAWDDAHGVTLCHHCSDKLETGDVYDVRAWTNNEPMESYEGEDGKRTERIRQLEVVLDKAKTYAALEEMRDGHRWVKEPLQRALERKELLEAIAVVEGSAR